MNEDDIKLAGELAKAAADSALELIKNQVTNLFSPLTKEAGLLFALPIQFLRFKAKVVIGERAMKFLHDRGVKPQQIPVKLLSPILEYGCLEDDQRMTDRWAALLANAADPKFNLSILPSFPDILRQLSPKEAAILDKVYGVFVVGGTKAKEWSRMMVPIKENFDECDPNEFAIAVDNLARLDLLRTLPASTTSTDPHSIVLTRLGLAFVSACRPPGPPADLKMRNYVEQNPVATRRVIHIGGPSTFA